MRIITVFTCVCLGSGAIAATVDQDSTEQRSGREQTYSSTNSLQRATSSQQVLFRAEPLLGRSVQTQNGQELGELNEIVFHPDVGIFGVIEAENDRFVPVPWKHVMAVTHNALVLDIDAQNFQQAPSFADGEWATFNSPQFTRQVNSYFKQGSRAVSTGSAAGQTAAARTGVDRDMNRDTNRDTNVTFSSAVAAVIEGSRDTSVPTNRLAAGKSGRPEQILYRAEPLIGRTISSPRDQELGELNDIVFHPDVGVYAVVEAEGGRLVPVPWSLVTAVTEETIVMNVAPQSFQSAPGIEDGNWASFNSPRFTRSIDAHFMRSSVGGTSGAGLQGTDTGAATQSVTNRSSDTQSSTNAPGGGSSND